MKISPVYALVIGLAVLFLSSGCAVGNKYAYDRVTADIAQSGTRAVGVAVHDQREYVKSGERKATFAGLQRGGFGNPFAVSTASNRPLADDMAAVVTSSLQQKGFKAVSVLVVPSEGRKAALEKLKATRAERLILITLEEWKSDTYQNTSLDYRVNAQVLDQAGKVLAEKAIQGKDDLGGSAWNPPAHARKAVPAAFKGKIEQLLNSDEIRRAL